LEEQGRDWPNWLQQSEVAGSSPAFSTSFPIYNKIGHQGIGKEAA